MMKDRALMIVDDRWRVRRVGKQWETYHPSRPNDEQQRKFDDKEDACWYATKLNVEGR